MKKTILSVLVLGLAPVLAQTTSPATSTPMAASTPAAPAPAVLTIGGLVDAPQTLTVDALKAMPSKTVTVSYTSGAGATFKNNTHTFRGVLLYDLLTSTKPRFNAAAKNDPLRWVVRAAAADNYVAVFAWGELDPAFGNKGVLVAYEQDGQPVEGGVQLVAPGDGKGGRYVGHLTTLQVFRADY